MITRPGLERGFTKRLNWQLFETGDYAVVLDKNKEASIALAQRASEQSPHYDRVTRFGAVAIALCETEYGMPYFKAFLGNNRSEVKGAPKSCAEMGIDALSKWYCHAKARGRMMVVSMAIFGPSDPERIFSITGSRDYEQCPPCHDCLGRLACNSAFLYDTTIILANSLGSSEHALGDLDRRVTMNGRPLASRELLAAA